MTLYIELIPGTGGHLSSDSVVPDRAGGRIVAFQYAPNPTYLGLFNYTTGARLSETNFAAIGVVSGTDTVADRSFCVGADGFLYVISSTYANDQGDAHVSKINLGTLLEVAAVRPTLLSNTGNYSSTFDFYLVPFQSAGVQYLALVQENSSATNVEIIDASTMTSVAAGIYPNSGDRIIPCPGGANAGEVYVLTTNWGSPTNCHLDKVVYTVGGGLVMTTVATIAPTDFVAAWTDINNTGSMVYDPGDGTLCTWAEGDDGGYMFKLNKATGAVVWRAFDKTTTDYFSGTNLQGSLISGSLANLEVLNTVTLTDLTDGSSSSQVFNQHATWDYTCQVWNGDNRTVIVADSGSLSGSGQWGILNYDAIQAAPRLVIAQGGLDAHGFVDPQSIGTIFVLSSNIDDTDWWLRKKSTVDDSVAQTGPVLSAAILSATGFSDMAFRFEGNIGGAWTDDNFVYMPVYSNPTTNIYHTSLVQLSRTTLAVLQAFPGVDYNTSGTDELEFGTYLTVSMDGTWAARFGDNTVNPLAPPASTTFIASFVELWNTTNGDHSYIDLTGLGINGLVVNGVFDAAGHLWAVEQPRDPTGITGQHKYAQSILHKLSVSGSPTPALTILSSTTIPDNYYPLGTNPDFDAFFYYPFINYHQPSDTLFLWATDNASEVVHQGWFRAYHIGSATLDAVQDWPHSSAWGQPLCNIGWTTQSKFTTFDNSVTPSIYIYDTADFSSVGYDIETTWTNCGLINSNQNQLFFNEDAGAVLWFGDTYDRDAAFAATEPVFTLLSSSLDVNLVGVEAHGEVAELGITSPLPSGMLPQVIPSFLYQEYNDDDDMQAFVAAYNTIAQEFADWFNALHLPIYTQDPISGALLDWVAEGLYGMRRPALGSGNRSVIGPFNTYGFNVLPYNMIRRLGSQADFVTTDDFFRRILTWHIQKSYGKVFNIRWLKRRIMQFLLGVDGVPFNVDSTYQISVTFGIGNQVNINFLAGVHSTLGGALFNRMGFNQKAYNELNTSFVPFTPLINIPQLKAAIQSGALELPFQFTYVVNEP
jgi:hypothetical protein